MLTPYAWTVPGGVNNHIAALAERFTAQGHRVTIIAPSDDRLAVKAARERVREVLLGERDSLFAPDEPYPRHFFAGGTFSVRHNRSVSYLSPPIDLLSNVDVVLENEEFDVLHIHEPFVPSLGWSAMNHAECPIVATFHANSERFFWYWLGKPILKRVFPVFDGVIAVSQAARDTAARYFAGQFRVVPNGIDLSRFQAPLGRRPGPVRVLYVGGDSRRKGLGVLLRALRYVSADLPPFELDVCGSDLHADKFGRLVPERFADRVRFRGRIAHDELPELYQDADIFCAPSLGNESFGIVLLEAMATDTSVLASDIEGYRDVVRDGVEGLLVPPRNARALAAGLERLLRDTELRDACAARGLESVRRYSWDIVSDEVDAALPRRHRRAPAPPVGAAAPPRARAVRRLPRAHELLQGLRHGGRRGPRAGRRGGSRRDGHHRPQRDRRRPRGAGAGRALRRARHRGRRGQDLRGRGHRPLPEGTHRPRHDLRRDASPRSSARAAWCTCRTPSTGCTPCRAARCSRPT